MCAHCRRVLDATGVWRGDAAAVPADVPVLYSHGICPACESCIWDAWERGLPLGCVRPS